MSHQRLFLIDGNSFCYRAFYAIRALANSKGQPTNAVYGFVTMLNKLIKDEKPDLIAIAFDLKGPTFRHKRFDEYKVHRKPMPDDLVSQMPLIKETVQAYNIPIFEMSGYEADDVLATVAVQGAGRGCDVFIVTGDKDALQLVNDRIRVASTHKEGLIYDAAKVRETYGVTPDRMVEIMALMGDASDNIPGVRGIGEKTAIELIKEFDTVENLYRHLDAIKSESRRRILTEGEQDALMSRELAVLDRQVPLTIDWDALKLKAPDNHRLIELFREFEFRTLVKDLTPAEKLDSTYETVQDAAAFARLVDTLAGLKEFAFDFETTSEDPLRADLVGVAFSWNVGHAVYVPVNKYHDIDAVLVALKPVFETPRIRKIGQNIKYEYMVLARYDIVLDGIAFDTMIASYLLNPSKMSHNLEAISLDWLDHKMTTPIEALIGKGKNATTMDKVDVERVAAYCCEDADVTFRLKAILAKEIAAKGLDDLLYKVEIPLVSVLADMEIAGVSIDRPYLQELSVEMEEKLATLTAEIYAVAGETFNINSPKQLSKILFEKLQLPIIRRTKTGISTDEEVLTKLAAKHELPARLLRYRELSKLKSTYIDSLPQLVNPATDRVHTSFNQTVTATGRLSSSDPNLQNIPIKTEEGRRIRRAFVPSGPGNVLLSADYSQIELRVLAHFSNDAHLIKAFSEGRDIHAFTASLVFGVDESAVTDAMRGMAKTVNFGIVYGMSPYGLSQSLTIAVDKAKDFIDQYFARYPGVKTYMDGLIAEARAKGYVTTILGRRRYIPEIDSPNAQIRQFAERTAINTPIQGSAADIIKAAMITIGEKLSDGAHRSKMILQVHDELVFDVPKKELKDVYRIVRAGMEHVMQLKVPVAAHIEAGENWLDMEEYTA